MAVPWASLPCAAMAGVHHPPAPSSISAEGTEPARSADFSLSRLLAAGQAPSALSHPEARGEPRSPAPPLPRAEGAGPDPERCGGAGLPPAPPHRPPAGPPRGGPAAQPPVTPGPGRCWPPVAARAPCVTRRVARPTHHLTPQPRPGPARGSPRGVPALGARPALTADLAIKASMAPLAPPAAARRKDTGDTGRHRPAAPRRLLGGGAAPPPSWSGAKPAPPSWGRAESRGAGGLRPVGVGAGMRLLYPLPSPGAGQKGRPARRVAPPLSSAHTRSSWRRSTPHKHGCPAAAEEAVPRTNMAARATTVAGRSRASR